jgi:lipopolysaccharide/colanic/teichoic acid biosynthesis glycosyltransferase
MNPSVKKSHDVPKTILDYLITFILLILLMPVIVILTLLIILTGNGPAIYSQKRIGMNGKPFIIYKFRSMANVNDEGLKLISGRADQRITSLGRFMRKHKFDEIPNFINVLKGEMSLIGPRPEQQFYFDQIIKKEPRYKQLQSIKPGITSWGQVKYGYATNIDEMIARMEYDLYYLENRSLRFDMKIAIKTLVIVIKGQGI